MAVRDPSGAALESKAIVRVNVTGAGTTPPPSGTLALPAPHPAELASEIVVWPVPTATDNTPANRQLNQLLLMVAAELGLSGPDQRDKA